MAADEEILKAPGPWKNVKGDVYLFSWWMPAGKTRATGLPEMAYSPLEGSASSPFKPSGAESAGAGRPVGGLAMIQLVRYTDTPVGPYDELIIAPGFHEYAVEDEKGRRRVRKNARITRIYVSQKHTCWNGRKNWNIPKHLAAFTWDSNADGSTTVKVFPHDAHQIAADNASEAKPSPEPFFQATVKPVRFVPNFPLSLGAFGWLGIDLALVQPPLPEKAEASQGELPGTDRWCSVVTQQSCRSAKLAWFDLRQGEGSVAQAEGRENFWPGLGRWHVGVMMKGADMEIPEGTHWDAPRSLL